MNYDKLIQQLDLDLPADKEISVLKDSMVELVSHLRAMLPANAQVFDHLRHELEHRLTDTRRKQYNVMSFFTGHGMLAKKLREHLVVSRWMQEHEYPANGAETTYGNKIREQLERFDFKPTKDVEQVKQLNNFITSIRPKILSTQFSSPKPLLTEPFAPDQVESGIYGDPTDANSFVVILRTSFEPRDRVETLLVYGPQSANLWYFHPFEGKWINSTHDVTFEGVREQLEKEFEKVWQAAGPIESTMSFEDELKIILQKASNIFENEQLLPVKYEMSPERIDKRFPLLPTGFERSMDDSCIIVSADSYSLLIRNTRGAYPSRTHHFMQNYTTLPSTATVDEMSESVKRMLIKRAYSAFNNLETIINQARQQRNK